MVRRKLPLAYYVHGLFVLQAVLEKTGERPTHRKLICCGAKLDSINHYESELEVRN